jgi:methylated-DNA-protein-cysteine methyltransferase related protein
VNVVEPIVVEPFARRVTEVVAATRPGQVLTYGEVAAEAGQPGAARAVGQVLRRAGAELPWWRVVTAAGRLVPGLEEEHAARLAREGITCRDGRVRAPEPYDEDDDAAAEPTRAR